MPVQAGGASRDNLKANLQAHLRYLSVDLGDRSVYQPRNLQAAADYVVNALRSLGYETRRQSFAYQGQEVHNIIAGSQPADGYYILGAHYDTAAGTPGADDNASGVAVLLEVARLARQVKLPRPWSFISFVCEEPPAFDTPYMGSRIYARRARQQQEKILGMLCLEMVGYYSRKPESQTIPSLLKFFGYPTTGDFIGLVGDRRSRPMLKRLEAALKEGCQLPTQTLTAPLGGRIIPEVRLSDHASFWDAGYPAIMLTDTAFMRNPNYHGPDDVMEHLDLEAMTELTLGVVNFLRQEGK
jgi:Zn-dependent M28 family amino/carboxypeptidase